MPKISICIPAYSQVQYLEKALTSIVSQGFNDYEIIVTDDSPDSSVLDLLQRFNFGKRLRYFRNTSPLGAPCNWNYGIEMAQGDYIKIMHHDDWFLRENSLGVFVDMLEQSAQCDFAFSGSLIVDQRNGLESLHSCSGSSLEIIREKPESLFFGNLIGAPSATIFRRSAFLSLFDTKLKWLVDVDFYIRCIRNSRSIRMTEQCLIATPTNASHQVTETCRSNLHIELFEYQYLFNKNFDVLVEDPRSIKFLRGLFERFHIRTLDDMQRLDVELLLSPILFKSIRPRHWLMAKLLNRIKFS